MTSVTSDEFKTTTETAEHRIVALGYIAIKRESLVGQSRQSGTTDSGTPTGAGRAGPTTRCYQSAD